MSSRPTKDRAKFLRYYGNLQLRVEQIGPNLWVGSVYAGCITTPAAEGTGKALHLWHPRFTDMTEDAAKHDALAMANNVIGPAPDGSDLDWRNLSDASEESWSTPLAQRNFPGYPEREGVERWEGF